LGSEIISFENHCYTAYSVIAVMFDPYTAYSLIAVCLIPERIKNCYLNVQLSAGWGLLLIFFIVSVLTLIYQSK
jgi:hypothetical protein